MKEAWKYVEQLKHLLRTDGTLYIIRYLLTINSLIEDRFVSGTTLPEKGKLESCSSTAKKESMRKEAYCPEFCS